MWGERFHFRILSVWEKRGPNSTHFQLNLHTKCEESFFISLSGLVKQLEGENNRLTGKIINKIHENKTMKHLTNLQRLLSMMIFLYKHVTKAK